METSRVTDLFDRGVVLLQMVIAALLVALLVLGVVALSSNLVEAVLAREILDLSAMLGVINSTIDIILYLFIIVELYRTIIAYVDAKNVVLAVVHAGLIAVVRQIITFKPADYSPQEALAIAGVYTVLLIPLLAGFLVVHRETGAEGDG